MVGKRKAEKGGEEKVKELGLFLQGVAQLTREGVIAKKLAAFIAKKALREAGYMPVTEKKEKKNAVSKS